MCQASPCTPVRSLGRERWDRHWPFLYITRTTRSTRPWYFRGTADVLWEKQWLTSREPRAGEDTQRWYAFDGDNSRTGQAKAESDRRARHSPAEGEPGLWSGLCSERPPRRRASTSGQARGRETQPTAPWDTSHSLRAPPHVGVTVPPVGGARRPSLPFRASPRL